MPSSYKSLLFYAPGDVRVEDVPFSPLTPGEVRVRVAAATTCGTDMKTFRRGHPVLIKTVPSPLGHEMCGTVVETAPDVAAFKTGDRVAIANSAPCGTCFYCRKDKPNLCEDIVFLNGAFAEYLTVPARIVRSNMVTIPDTLAFENAVLAEPLACVVHACEHMRISPGETVAIIGTGPMAFLFVQVIKSLDARSIVLGRNAKRLDQIASCGANEVVDVTAGDPVANVKRLTEGHGTDVVIEAVGLPETWRQAVDLARKGGRVCLYGGCERGTKMELDTYRVHYEEITVSGIFHYTPAIFKRAVELLAEGRIDTALFLTERRGLMDLPRILAGKDPAKPLKFLIEP
jgi:L-iditol 2-dehydrogenase